MVSESWARIRFDGVTIKCNVPLPWVLAGTRRVQSNPVLDSKSCTRNQLINNIIKKRELSSRAKSYV